ncbi:MAG: hypothetical protein JWL73_3544, partial [Actinomycetia bacterium]|nr:hypothetical protein [Actinomycetes bacterium]
AARSPIARNVVGPRRVTPLRPPIAPPWEREASPLDALGQALLQVRLDLHELRRPQLPVGPDGMALPNLVVDADSRSWESRPGRVSVIMALYNHAQYVVDALESAVSGGFADVEVVVVDDGSTDDSARVVREWIDRTPHRAVRLLRHRVNRGLPSSRNDAISHARGDLVFVLDADNEIFPTGLQRLVAALDADPDATFAYGVLQTFDTGGPQGLLGYYPWQPWRLRYGNYIDAMALIRRSALLELGGYAEERRLYGWEDYDLWCRLAEKGAYAVHVASPVARYRSSRSSMISMSNLSHTAAFDALRERAPQLMSGGLEDWEHPLTDWLNTVKRTYAAHRHLLSELGDRAVGSPATGASAG